MNFEHTHLYRCQYFCCVYCSPSYYSTREHIARCRHRDYCDEKTGGTNAKKEMAKIVLEVETEKMVVISVQSLIRYLELREPEM